ncbi:MAG: sugar transferase [Planctomycetota bacterium]|nr:sugar transferase [Planctomycetota bacterium]
MKLLQALVLLVGLPVAATVALPIVLVNLAIFRRLDRVLYRQERMGRRGRTFSMIKFRTMRETSDAWSSWKTGADGLRVTRFGRFLRSTHLDELPQFLNILSGEMSLIGPRPEMVSIDAWAREHVPEFHRRLALKPGITGLSQVTIGYTGMDVGAYATKLRYDEAYRQNLSFRMDLSVLLRTALWMLRGRGWRWRTQEVKAERTGETAAV